MRFSLHPSCSVEDERICRETNPLADIYSQILECKMSDYDYLVRLFVHYGPKTFLVRFLLTAEQLTGDRPTASLGKPLCVAKISPLNHRLLFGFLSSAFTATYEILQCLFLKD